MNLAGILRGRLRLLRNALRPRRRTGGRPGAAVGAALTGAIGLFAFAVFHALFVLVAGAGAPAGEAAVALALAFSAALAGLLLFDLHFVLSALLLDTDLELLRRAPLPPAALFTLKLLDALPQTSELLVALVIPAAVAFAVVYPLAASGWMMLPFLIAALAAIPLGLGLALALPLVRRVPAAHAREALGLSSGLTLVLLYFVNAFLLPRLTAPSSDLPQTLRDTLRALPAGLALPPARWAADAVAAAAAGDTLGGLRAGAPVLLAGALALAIGAWSAAYHLEGAQLAAASPRARHRTRRPRPRARRGRAALGGALLGCQLRLFARDWTVMGDTLTSAALMTLLPLVGAPLRSASAPLLARAMLLALTIGLGFEVAARSVPFERSGHAWLRLAPVPPARWIAAQMAGAAALALPLLALAAGCLALVMPLSPRAWAETLCTAVPALGLSLAAGLWNGARYADPEWTNPRAMLSFAGRVVGVLLFFVQASLWIGFGVLAAQPRPGFPAGLALWGPALLAAVAATAPIGALMRRFATADFSA